MCLLKTKQAINLLTAIMLCAGTFSVPAHAAAGADLIAGASWLNDETDVLNSQTGEHTSLAVRLSDYLSKGGNSPYITVQAVDPDGNHSGIIQVRNPFYVPDITEDNAEEVHEASAPGVDEQPSRPGNLTPGGSGTVIDNVMDSDGIEFFTISTDDQNEFFLVVDRQRGSDNVYLLNTVTEEDLMALARRSGREIILPGAGADVLPPLPPEMPAPNDDEAVELGSAPAASGSGRLIIIIVAVALVGGAGYYFKIHRKKNDGYGMDSYDDEDEDMLEDDDWDYDSEDMTGGDDHNAHKSA